MAYRVLAGLGNPGKKYQGTRHNIGFEFLDVYAGALGASAWREQDNLASCEVVLPELNEKVRLVKPLKFMNLSGPPLREFLDFYKIQISELVVAHDEVDLPLGTLRIKSGGGDGGHNGIKSIVQSFGSPEFVRLRLGVGRPCLPLAAEPRTGSQIGEGPSASSQSVGRVDLSSVDLSNWVLGRFTGEESSTVKLMLGRAGEAFECLCSQGMKVAQNRFN